MIYQLSLLSNNTNEMKFYYLHIWLLVFITGCSISLEDQQKLGTVDSVNVIQSQKFVYFNNGSYRIPLKSSVKNNTVYYLTITRRPAAPSDEGLEEYWLCKKVSDVRDFRMNGDCIKVIINNKQN